MTTQLFTRYGSPQVANTTTGKSNAPAYSYRSTCSRCGGAGGADKWAHTGWTCFDCCGSGKGAVKVDRLYTEHELAKLDERAARARAARKALADAEAARLEAEHTARRQQFLADNAELLALIDECMAEERIAHMHRVSDHARRLSRDPYLTAPAEPTFWFKFKESAIERADITDRMVEVIRNGHAKALEARAARENGKHAGQIGQRLRGVKAEVVRSKHVATISRFPSIEKYLVVIKTEDGAELTWFTGHGQPLGECTIDFTVKEHGEYQGRPQTVVQRVTFKD